MTTQMTDTRDDDRTVRLAEHLAFSRSFQPLFNEGMALVDETAVYLDGDGRRDAKALSKPAATLYAAESMRLTTRLMQVASWLLLQRAANQGDMSRAQVEAEKVKVRLEGLGSAKDSPQYPDLPEAFRSLVERAQKLERRIAMLDREIYGSHGVEPATDSPNPVGEQIDLLRTAFHS
jgi:regulator of CtrA degradation